MPDIADVPSNPLKRKRKSSHVAFNEEDDIINPGMMHTFFYFLFFIFCLFVYCVCLFLMMLMLFKMSYLYLLVMLYKVDEHRHLSSHFNDPCFILQKTLILL